MVRALLSIAFAFLGAYACGDGVDSGSADSQNEPSPNPANDAVVEPTPAECSGAGQVGCELGQKCALVAQTWSCVRDGSIEVGASCQSGPQGDDCSGGLHCYRGTCINLCDDATPCSSLDVCVGIATGGDRAAVCLAACDPLAQDCPNLDSEPRQGCYLHISGDSVCAVVASSPPILPGQPCQYLNECAIGAGCVSLDGVGLCRAYCDFKNNTNAPDPRCNTEGRCRQLGGADLVGVCETPTP